MTDKTFLKPLRFWCQKILPLVYDDSLTYYEVLCKLTHYINNLINDTKMLAEDLEELRQCYKDLKNYVDNYFDNLDLQEEVNNWLNENIEFVITNTVFNTPNRFEAKFSNMWFTGKYSEYFGPEGCLDVGENIVAISGHYNNGTTDYQKIFLFNFNTGLYVGSTLTNLSHGSSMGFVNDKLYCYDSASHKIYPFELPSLTPGDGVELQSPIYGLASYDDKLYGHTSDAIYEIDITDGSMTKLFNYTPKGNFIQGLFCDGNYFYIAYSTAESVSIYTMSGTYINNFGLGNISEAEYPICELEGIFTLNGKYHALIWCGWDGSSGDRIVSNLAEASFTYPLISSPVISSNLIEYSFYLDDEIRLIQDGTRAKPYNAFLQVKPYSDKFALNVRILANTELDTVNFVNDNLSIFGEQNVVINSLKMVGGFYTVNDCTVNSITPLKCCLSLSNVTFTTINGRYNTIVRILNCPANLNLQGGSNTIFFLYGSNPVAISNAGNNIIFHSMICSGIAGSNHRLIRRITYLNAETEINNVDLGQLYAGMYVVKTNWGLNTFCVYDDSAENPRCAYYDTYAEGSKQCLLTMHSSDGTFTGAYLRDGVPTEDDLGMKILRVYQIV